MSAQYSGLYIGPEEEKADTPNEARVSKMDLFSGLLEALMGFDNR
jgi:hypothetical protein